MCVTMLRHMHARYGLNVGKRAAIITFYAGQVEVCALHQVCAFRQVPSVSTGQCSFSLCTDHKNAIDQALKAALAETFWGDGVTMAVPVHTVDSFQGCESDIVLLSMVRYGTMYNVASRPYGNMIGDSINHLNRSSP